MSRVDMMVFGATGFTGQYVVEHALRLAHEEGFTVGVAGRNESKLNTVLDQAEKVRLCICTVP
jgi:short subunit dehydrogenase-like uncharacterized protein